MDASDSQAARRATLKRLLTAGLGLALATFSAAPALGEGQQPKNVIIMFADGAAATQWDFGRYSSQALRQKFFITTDLVFKEGSLGLASTYSGDAYVTDSAAAGSAMSTGHKVKNGAVAVTPDGKAVRTVMEGKSEWQAHRPRHHGEGLRRDASRLQHPRGFARRVPGLGGPVSRPGA